MGKVSVEMRESILRFFLTRKGVWVLAALAALPVAAGAAHRAVGAACLAIGAAKPAELPGLHNVFRVSKGLYSGAAPEGDAGFQSLRALGIRTVISVDGIRPDVATAQRYRLRYVHLPFGYDGCPTPRALEIVRAARDLPGPLYVHCHHGQLRGPTAAALIDVALDGASNAEGVALIRRAGGDHSYRGLYGTVASFHRPAAAEIDRAPGRFPAVSPLPPLAATMVQIDARFTALQQSQRGGWRAPVASPAGEPADEALQLKELFHELQRTGVIAARPADFKGWMRAAERGTAETEAALRGGDDPHASAALGQVAAACGACHARYRNVPQAR